MSDVGDKLDQSECGLQCAGNSTETCGGHLKLGVFGRNSFNSAAGLKPLGLVGGSLLDLRVMVVALLFLTW